MVTILIFYRKILDNVLLRTFPTPPKKISTPLNFLNPPPPTKIFQLSPKKIFNPHPKFSQPPLKNLNLQNIC